MEDSPKQISKATEIVVQSVALVVLLSPTVLLLVALLHSERVTALFPTTPSETGRGMMIELPQDEHFRVFLDSADYFRIHEVKEAAQTHSARPCAQRSRKREGQYSYSRRKILRNVISFDRYSSEMLGAFSSKYLRGNTLGT